MYTYIYYLLTFRFSAIAHLQNAPNARILSSFQMLIFEKIYITEYFWKYLEPWKELTRFA